MQGGEDLLLIIAICAGLLLGAWYLGRPMLLLWRLGFLAAITLLLAGMTMPPELIRDWVAVVSR